MINIFMKNEIITLYRKGKKIKEIQRELNISRNTVRNYMICQLFVESLFGLQIF